MDGFTSEFGLYVRKWVADNIYHSGPCAAYSTSDDDLVEHWDDAACDCGYTAMVKNIERDIAAYPERAAFLTSPAQVGGEP